MDNSTQLSTEDFEIITEPIDCPLCDSKEATPYLTAKDYFYQLPGTYFIVRCRSCGHLYMNPRPTRASLRKCYPESYSLYADSALPATPQGPIPKPWYAKPPFRWIPGLRRLYRFLTETFAEAIPQAPSAEKAALELGCGVGAFLDKLREEQWKTQGVEFSQHATDIAARRGHKVSCMSIDDAEFDSESFDAVFAWMVIEHLQSPRKTFENIFHWLKPGGYFCLSVPNAGTKQTWVFGKYWFPYDLPRHLHHFTPKSISTLLVEAGFESPKVIHQRTVRSWYASLGAALLDRKPASQLGRKLIRWTDDTPFWLTLAVSPIALVLAFLRQSNRITVVAKKSAK